MVNKILQTCLVCSLSGLSIISPVDLVFNKSTVTNNYDVPFGKKSHYEYSETPDGSSVQISKIVLVEKVEELKFHSYYNVSNKSLPLTKIANNKILGNGVIKSVKFSDDCCIESISDCAFSPENYSQINFFDFSLLHKLQYIGKSAFELVNFLNNKFVKLDLSNTILKKIDDRAFFRCTAENYNSFDEIILPPDLEYIGKEVFSGVSTSNDDIRCNWLFFLGNADNLTLGTNWGPLINNSTKGSPHKIMVPYGQKDKFLKLENSTQTSGSHYFTDQNYYESKLINPTNQTIKIDSINFSDSKCVPWKPVLADGVNASNIEEITFSLRNAPRGLHINNITGELSWDDNLKPGIYTFRVLSEMFAEDYNERWKVISPDIELNVGQTKLIGGSEILYGSTYFSGSDTKAWKIIDNLGQTIIPERFNLLNAPNGVLCNRDGIVMWSKGVQPGTYPMILEASYYYNQVEISVKTNIILSVSNLNNKVLKNVKDEHSEIFTNSGLKIKKNQQSVYTIPFSVYNVDGNKVVCNWKLINVQGTIPGMYLQNDVSSDEVNLVLDVTQETGSLLPGSYNLKLQANNDGDIINSQEFKIVIYDELDENTYQLTGGSQYLYGKTGNTGYDQYYWRIFVNDQEPTQYTINYSFKYIDTGLSEHIKLNVDGSTCQISWDNMIPVGIYNMELFVEVKNQVSNVLFQFLVPIQLVITDNTSLSGGSKSLICQEGKVGSDSNKWTLYIDDQPVQTNVSYFLYNQPGGIFIDENGYIFWNDELESTRAIQEVYVCACYDESIYYLSYDSINLNVYKSLIINNDEEIKITAYKGESGEIDSGVQVVYGNTKLFPSQIIYSLDTPIDNIIIDANGVIKWNDQLPLGNYTLSLSINYSPYFAGSVESTVPIYFDVVEKKNEKKLSTGAKVGIIVGSCVAAGGISVGITVGVLKAKKTNKKHK